MLKNKTILITGASRGLGADTARVFAENGANVAVNYFKSKEKAEQLCKEINGKNGSAAAFFADVTSAGDVDAMVSAITDHFGSIDVLINNALPSYKFDPSQRYTSIETAEWEDFEKQYQGAVKAAYNCVRAVLPKMKDRNYGRIVNISTNLVYNPVVTYYDYTTAKAGMIGLTRNLAAELGQYGITVNLIAGGLLSETDASKVSGKEVFDTVAGLSPLKKVVTTDQFAKAALFFASDLSEAVTGQSISVDAGLTMT